MARQHLRRSLCALLLVAVALLAVDTASAQVENVPVSNQIYEFLERLGVRGILPLQNNAFLPLTRAGVADLLRQAGEKEDQLSDAERRFLRKFRAEFAHELKGAEEPFVLIGGPRFVGEPLGGAFSDREKYLYAFVDSSVSVFAEFLASLEYRRGDGQTWDGADATFGAIGGRFRGTALGKLGFQLQATNGELWGDHAFARSDPRFAGNWKLNEQGSAYFDFTEASLQLRLDWFTLQLGREQRRVGLGSTDRLMVSGIAPAFDVIKLAAEYGSFRFTWLHGSLNQDSIVSHSIPPGEELLRKYLSLHRIQFGLFGIMNFAASEMVIYQRRSPELAYLNPVNFYKSAEHSLGDQDNAFIVFDLDLFPVPGYKLFGTWMIDDMDFTKLGTGWWGNQFGWHAGLVVTDVASVRDVDAVLEYVRIEPYVYSHKIPGNNYTHNSISLGSRLQPNSDAVAIEGRYRPTETVRVRVGYAYERHGANEVAGDSLLRNVGGSILQGHREGDATTVFFLDGARQTTDRVWVRLEYEPVTNIMLVGVAEYRRLDAAAMGGNDLFSSLQVTIEY